MNFAKRIFGFFSTFQQHNNISSTYLLIINTINDHMNLWRKTLSFLPILLFPIFIMAQNSDRELGEEYYQKGDYEKAVIFFDKYLKAKSSVRPIYDHYYQCLIGLGELDKAEKRIRAFKRDEPLAWDYSIDLLLIKRAKGEKKDYEKDKEELFRQVGLDQLWTESSARHFVKRKEFDLAEELFLYSRDLIGNPTIYSQNLISLYQFSGKKLKMVDEALELVNYSPGYLKYVENQLQDYAGDVEVSTHLENGLIEKIQKDPNSLAFSQLLVWFYVQNKDFKSAFIQARSIDKRLQLQGKELMDLGEIIYDNKAYEEAIVLYKYVSEEYNASGLYPEAKRMEITCREELATSTFPVDTSQIRVVITEYENYLRRVGKRRAAAEAYRRMALLYAFQLSEYDHAIELLNEALLIPRSARAFSGQCKLDMGDIYLLKEEPWESKILYAQVEKSYKDQPLGHEGKFKLAKVYYYTGEFELAKANLDILKRATTRQIANDALDLSLLISDNSALDTSYDALNRFATLDLLYFSQHYLQAKEGFEVFLEDYPNHSLTDETYFKLAQIEEKMGEYNNAIAYLDVIISKYHDDILMDDALFNKALILDEKLEDKDQAMEVYKVILFDYPGSFYAEEARRRYRSLRGDEIN